jgi:ferrous iron transport protein B
MVFSVLYGIGIAWAAATVIYQIGTFAQHPQSSALWVAACVAAFVLLVVGLRQYGDRTERRVATQGLESLV